MGICNSKKAAPAVHAVSFDTSNPVTYDNNADPSFFNGGSSENAVADQQNGGVPSLTDYSASGVGVQAQTPPHESPIYDVNGPIPEGNEDDDDDDVDNEENDTMDLDHSIYDQRSQASRPEIVVPSETGFHASVNGRNGWRFDDIYEVGDEVGSGAFGSVYIGRHKLARDGDVGIPCVWQKVAIKLTRPNSLDTKGGRRQLTTYDDLERKCQEIRTLIRLQAGSPQMSKVLYMYEYFMSGRDIYVVTELCGQELDDWRSECDVFTERMAIDISRTILKAISYMHSRGVVHRDLKLQNILFKKNGDFKSLKIVDFGLARILKDDEAAKDFCGSPGYLAPEIYKGKSYRFEVDMFAFGVLLFRLLSGERPFPANNSQILKRHTVELKYTVQGADWEAVSDAAKDMIRKLLINRQERMSADQALKHAWFKEAGQSMLKVDLTHLQEDQDSRRSRAFARSRPRTETATRNNANRFWIDSTAQMAVATLLSTDIYDAKVVDAAYNDETNRAKGGMICIEEVVSPILSTAPQYVGSLETRYTEKICRNIFFQVVQCVRTMHEAGLAHRNIHLENILIDPWGKVSIRGLHQAHPIEEGVPLTGHFGFIYSWYAFKAPEVDVKFYHTKACDLWSLGAVAYMLMTGLPPFRGNGIELVHTKHNGDVDFEIVMLSGAAQRMIRGLLQVEVEQRMTIEDVMNSEWMRVDDEYLDQFDLDIARGGLADFQLVEDDGTNGEEYSYPE